MIKTYEQFMDDPYGEERDDDFQEMDAEDIPDDEMVDVQDLYDVMSDYLDQANVIYCNFTGENPDEVDNCSSPEDALDCLDEVTEDHGLYAQARELYDKIDNLQDQIDEAEAEEYFDDDDDED